MLSLTGIVALSGCVANSTLPSQNVSVLLDTSAETQTDPAKPVVPSLAPTDAKPKPPAAVESKLSPAVKNAIVPTAKDTPAQTATNQVVKPQPKPIAPPATVAEKATAEKSVPTGAARQAAVIEKKTSTQPAKTDAQEPTQVAAVATQTKEKPKSLFGALLQANRAGASKPKAKKTAQKTASRTTKVKLRKGQKSSLPGVKLKKVWGIETDETEERDEPVRVAAVTNLARRGTHGLLLQRKNVKVHCFPRDLLRILKRVERRFGRTPIVTSGYRSPAYNRRIRGAKRSMHISCKAADIQVRGVSKWKLARYLRTIPGRGGVGTYCHTASVHIDVGQKRDWNRRCRRKRR